MLGSDGKNSQPSTSSSSVRRQFYPSVHRVLMGRSLRWLARAPVSLRQELTTEIRARSWELYAEDERLAAVRMRSMPVSLHLQTTQKCNFRCIMCTRQQNPEQPRRTYACMDEELLRQVAHEGFAYARSIDLTVSGEPLLARNLDESLRLARLYNVPVHITTNGSLLGRPGMLDKLMPSLELLVVSLDAASPATFDKIRPGGKLDQIVAAVMQYSRMRHAQQRHMELEIAAVLMRRNIEELPDMVRLAHRLGADLFRAEQMVVTFPAMVEESLLNYPDLFNRYRAQAAAVAESLGQTVMLPAPLDTASTSTRQAHDVVPAGPVQGPIRCPFSHRSLYIQTDGSALPCCNEDPEIPIMGNIREQSIREIWNGERYLELREGLRTGRLTSYCRRCYIIADQLRLPNRGLMKSG